ncbi:Arylsulfatase [Planctomycetes bacterium Pla163]|uniref:Arylsulfatase n=1 Tax=Rohdeia mirabilis TaxID=2528008 RepID=A0A518D3N2_9BACT|nr:Arylsulfatase [Planctomycetes bacterium Pla163]
MRFLLALVALALPLAAPARAQVAAESAVVIVLDDVGWQDIVVAQTFTFDLLSVFGRRFNRAYTTSVCSPSRYQMIYGRYPHRDFIGDGLVANASDPNDVGVPARSISIGSVLSAQGFSTAMFGKWHLNNRASGVVEEAPRVRGFQTWRKGIVGNLINGEDHYNWTSINDGVQVTETEYSTTVIGQSFLNWWSNTEGRKLAYVSFAAAHEPHNAAPANLLPPGYVIADSDRARFVSQVVALDTAIAQMACCIDFSKTLLIVVADNGTPGDVVPPFQLSPGYKLTQFDGGTNVPFWALGAGVVPAVGGGTDALIQTCDLPATLLEVLGVDAPAGFEDSISFAAELTNTGPPIHARQMAFVQRFGPNGGEVPGLLYDDWALIRADGPKVLVNAGSAEKAFDVVPGSLVANEWADLAGTAMGAQWIADALSARSALLGPNWPY